MQKRLIVIAAVLGFLGVALGAFGAHGLEATLTANGRSDTFETASRYHLIHSVALLAVAWLVERFPGKLTEWAGYFFIIGILLFSGSLYMLAIFDLGFMGAVAPFGGASLLAGWACIALAAWRDTSA